MAYYPKERNVSGIFYYGNAGSDQVLETNSSFTYNAATDTLTVGNLNGNSTSASIATDASGLTAAVTVSLANQITGEATFQDAGDTATINTFARPALISDQTAAVGAQATDLLLILSGTELRKVTKANFVSDLGGGTMSDFVLTGDGGPGQTIEQGNNLLIAGGSGISTTVGATDTVTVNLTDTAVTAGSYGSSSAVGTFTVDANGRLTAASNVTIDGASINNNSITITAGSGLADGGAVSLGGSVTLNVGAGSLIDVQADVIDVDLTEAAAATIADNDELIFLDGGTTESKGSTRDLASLFAGAGLTATNSTLSLTNSSVTVQGDSGSTTLDLGETLDIGGGSGILTTVSAGSPEQVTVDLTVTSVTAGSYGSSTAVGTFTVDANGRLTAASNTNIDGSSISNNTITFSANAGSDQSVQLGQTLEISGGAATNTTMSATNIATIDVKYDNQTIGLSSDQLIVKDAGVTEVKRQRTVDSSFSNGEVISSDINLVNANAGSILLNLPAPPVSAGRLLYIKKTDSSSNTVTIDQNSSETIDGGTQYLLYNQYEAVTLICDGTNWHVF
jgi:hypothetical protein